jgi:hypothetical protein
MLTAIEMLALNKAMAKKDSDWARGAVVPGTFPVDVTVRISGDVSVGADGDRAGTSKLLSEEFVMLALHMAGCTRERAIEIIRNIAGLADKKSRKEMLASWDSEGVVQKLFADLKAAVSRTPVKGEVAFAGSVEVVTSAAQEAQESRTA